MSENENLSRGLKNRHVQLLAIGGAIGTGYSLDQAGLLAWLAHLFYLRMP